MGGQGQFPNHPFGLGKTSFVRVAVREYGAPLSVSRWIVWLPLRFATEFSSPGAPLPTEVASRRNARRTRELSRKSERLTIRSQRLTIGVTPIFYRYRRIARFFLAQMG